MFYIVYNASMKTQAIIKDNVLTVHHMLDSNTGWTAVRTSNKERISKEFEVMRKAGLVEA